MRYILTLCLILFAVPAMAADTCRCEGKSTCTCAPGTCQCIACADTSVMGEQVGGGWLSNQKLYPGWYANERTGEWRKIEDVQLPTRVVHYPQFVATVQACAGGR